MGEGVDLLGGGVDDGGLPLGAEPAQRQGQDVIGDAVDHRVADLEDTDPVGAVHGDGVDDGGRHTQDHDCDQPGGQELRAGVEGAQEGDHEGQGEALEDGGGYEPGDDGAHLGGVDDSRQQLPHDYFSSCPADSALSRSTWAVSAAASDSSLRSWLHHMAA